MSSEDLKKFQEITLRILEYYTKAVQFGVSHVEKAMKDIEELEQRSGINAPLKIYEFLSDLYSTLAQRYITSETGKSVDFFNKAIKLREKILSNKPENSLRAEILLNLGMTYGSLGDVRDPEENFQKAIKAYHEALTIFTKKDFPIEYAMAQNNLGTAFGSLGNVRDPEENCQKAIKACQEALTIYTKKDFPTDYAGTQNNLGMAYHSLGDVRDPEENCQKAIKAYHETLTIYTKKDFPTDYAMTQNNLGNAYGSLGDVRDPEENFQKAIKAYHEALTIYTKKDFPTEYANTKNNLDISLSRKRVKNIK